MPCPIESSNQSKHFILRQVPKSHRSVNRGPNGEKFDITDGFQTNPGTIYDANEFAAKTRAAFKLEG